MRPADSHIAETLRALREAFESLGLRWYVFGAQAAILYGSSRMTEDVDVTLDPGRVTTKTILEALDDAGFSPRTEDIEVLAVTARVLPIEHRGSGTPVDVVLAGPGLEEDFASRARHHSIAGETVPVAAVEDLVVMKLLAHRPHDIEDVIAVLRANRATIDLDRARVTLVELEAAIEDDSLVSRLDEALRRVREKGDGPR
ncbi:MAG: nucleotidyl transferase AbiEii/AbiGii toxin family protein [Deltaproteobacteria bacterium]|nr:nucleotidyl transferase AbiEii/AbiGii toxin family protein [Deltaproteobacteria bacterium]